MKKRGFMNTPDFKVNKIVPYSVLNDKKQVLCNGMMNEKAWLKTIENSVIWEFISDNERVIEKNIAPYSIKVEDTIMHDGVIVINATSDDINIQSEIDLNMVISNLESLIIKRKIEMPENSYTTHLFSKGEDKILKKFGEEAIELILAKNSKDETIYEAADVFYHLIVYLVYKGIPFNDIVMELSRRMNK